jgi:uncharacterized membrane protein YraQ (UPF0718 family)
MSPLGLYLGVCVLVGVSFVVDREKTKIALRRTLRAFMRLLPDMSFILLLVGLSLAVISPEVISRWLGDSSGFVGISVGLLVGSVSFLPSFIAFPLGATLLQSGAGMVQTGAFISALMGVGVLTLSLEKKTFGTRFAVARNLSALVAALIFAGVLALVGGGSG